MTNPQRYPLHWPAGWKRTPFIMRTVSRFKVSMARARDDMFAELERMTAAQIVLSSDLQLRRDGLPLANQASPRDSGVAVYFRWRNKPYVLACDTYLWVEANIRAVGKTVEAMRAIERHGASTLLERAFSGFSELPAQGETGMIRQHWWNVLGLDKPPKGRAELKNARNNRLHEVHPDLGGSNEAMIAVNRAYEEGCQAMSHG